MLRSALVGLLAAVAVFLFLLAVVIFLPRAAAPEEVETVTTTTSSRPPARVDRMTAPRPSPTTTSTSTTTTTAPPVEVDIAEPEVETADPNIAPATNDDFLACVLKRESEGQYGAVDPTGQWRGGYQFSPSTWDNTARHAGRSDLVGVSPDQASPADQDAMAQHLYAWQGTGPWAGGRYAC